jgi:hypothetical protein
VNRKPNTGEILADWKMGSTKTVPAKNVRKSKPNGTKPGAASAISVTACDRYCLLNLTALPQVCCKGTRPNRVLPCQLLAAVHFCCPFVSCNEAEYVCRVRKLLPLLVCMHHTGLALLQSST